jgi:iron-sulfur cluster repair protein YtfE (RIC family)
MKRDNSLRTLSWEHHDGLVLTFRIERGLKYHRNPQLIRKYLFHVWDNDLTHHFWQEEQVLPAVLQKSSEGGGLLAEMIRDHKWFERHVENLQGRNEVSEEELRQFAQRLNDHIRFEERELFPFIENHAGRYELERIGGFLQKQHRPKNECWEPAFWR